jgi:cytochrome c-type biogenesis protein CcmH
MKGSSSFLKKRTKKLLRNWTEPFRRGRSHIQKFFASFFQKRSPFFLFLLLAAPAFAVSDPKEMLPNPAQEARAEAVGSQLRCLVCQNESIEESQAPLAGELRAIVRQRIVAGDSDKQIIAWMVARYGQFVRLRPPLAWDTLLLYATPFLGLAIGAVAVWFGRGHRELPQPLSEAEQAKLAELSTP